MPPPPNHPDTPPESTGGLSEPDRSGESDSDGELPGVQLREILDEVLNSENPVFDEEEDVAGGETDSESDDETNTTLRVLQYLSKAGTTLSEVLNDVLFGSKEIRNNHYVVNARKNLFKSSVLPSVLDRIRSPPGMQVRGKAHMNARVEVETWALETSQQILRKELVKYAATTQSSTAETDVVSEESLKLLTFDAIFEQIEEHSPRLYEFLTCICAGKRQDRNKLKDPKFCITIFINALANQASQYNNAMQKLLCIYFKAKGVPNESYQWSVNALNNISKAAMEKAIQIFEMFPCLVIHDNIRLPFPVKHQRTHNLTVSDNGTAMTMMPLRDSAHAQALLRNPDLWKDHNKHITEMYRDGSMLHFRAQDIFSHPGFQGDRKRMISNILCFLFDIPALKQSELVTEKRQHELLVELPPIHQLPYGPEHSNRQYMLETIPQEEATYGGNYAIMKEAPRQLGIDTQEKLETWASMSMTPWVGDALTIHRLRWLQRMKVEDPSTFERLKHLLLSFGWLHLDMNLCNAIYYHHYGEHSTSGLARDAAALHRSGLTKPTKKRGPQYHTIDEFLQHTTSSRMRGLWLWATSTTDVQGLMTWVTEATPRQIREVAEKIWLERVSNRALETFSDDTSLCNAIALNRDLLLRHEVWTSTRRGDVGRMEHTLPLLLVFFLGAGASNYAREIAEVLHWRKYEAPPGVADLVRDECWVLNTRGKADTFYPFDLRQELNNLSIKEHGPPPHGSTWESHRRWAPALPVFTAVVQQVDECFHDFYRSRKHYVPDAEPDIRLLMKRHAEQNFNEYNPEQPENQIKRTHDCVEAGRVKIFEKNYLDDLAQERIRYLTYSSSLELAGHQGLSIEQILERIQQDTKHTATNTQSTHPHRLLGASSHENQDEIELMYDFSQTEDQEQDPSTYEGQCHRLADAWGC